MINFRTDLADERHSMYRKANKLDEEIDGISVQSDRINKDVCINRVTIENKRGEEAINKPIGKYITIDMKNLNIVQDDEMDELAGYFSNELQALINEKINDKDEILVVGLGNIYVTPDALGPKVIEQIEVTRHIIKYLPQYIDENSRAVCAISPGVLGTTGIETVEIIKGIVDNIKPKLLVVIDALASKSIERINKTIQIANTGIVPGAGVGNTRKEISEKTLGIPVISVGVPTVVESAVMVNECLDIFIEKLQNEAKSNDYLNQMKEKDNYEEIKEALIPKDYNLIVTPKEIDELVEKMAKVVSMGINMAM